MPSISAAKTVQSAFPESRPSDAPVKRVAPSWPVRAARA
jgi:hypothetical protein